MKFKKVCEEKDIATLQAKYRAKKQKEEEFRKIEYENNLRNDFIKTRSRLKDVDGNMIPMRYLRDDDERYTKFLNTILNEFNAGTLLIDFAVNPKDNKQIMLDVEFREDCIWLFGKGKKFDYKVGSKGPIQRFNSVNEFINSMTTSIYSINQFVDKERVRKNLFDPESFDRIAQQIRDFAKDFPNKGKSLEYNNDNWDIEIKFRRSLRKLSKSKFINDTSSDYVIYPAISGENKWGRIISPEEDERFDPDLW